MRERVAIVGGGVSGLVVAYLLHPTFDITIFDAAAHPGGHVHTVEVEIDGRTLNVDVGFIVYNEQNYPNFSRLLAKLGTETQPSFMSFSVSRRNPDFEYNGSSLNQLFAQRRNLIRPAFYGMLRDIVHFSRHAPGQAMEGASSGKTLRDLVCEGRYGRSFVDHYLIPLGSALWSAPAGHVLDMPADFFVRFLENHGMLSLGERPQWRVIAGGSSRYVEALTAGFSDRIVLRSPVKSVRRSRDHVDVDGARFDHVVLACHSDQALAILDDASTDERDILGAITYQTNRITLHTDVVMLPRRRTTWAAWNYHLVNESDAPVSVTYNMNILQSLDAPEQLCVTLNDSGRIDDSRVLYETEFAHPQYTIDAFNAQQRIAEISGVRRTHYCGAYWGNGFHEDGVTSALRIGRHFGVSL